MKRYKLLKDLPTFKAGQLAYISKTGNLIAGTPENQKTTETGLIIMIYHETTLKKFPEILTEWFEEISGPTDSIHWRPKHNERYWFVDAQGGVKYDIWFDLHPVDQRRYNVGNIYRTEKECTRARDRQLAEARLRRTSTFKPDFNNKNTGNGYVVGYDYLNKKLFIERVLFRDYGEVVYYETKEEAKISVEENREDWLTYFGIKKDWQ